MNTSSFHAFKATSWAQFCRFLYVAETLSCGGGFSAPRTLIPGYTCSTSANSSEIYVIEIPVLINNWKIGVALIIVWKKGWNEYCTPENLSRKRYCSRLHRGILDCRESPIMGKSIKAISHTPESIYFCVARGTEYRLLRLVMLL